MSVQEIQTKAKEIKEYTRMREELEAEITALQDEIKAEMLKQDTEQLVAGEYKIRYTTVTSNRLDTTALKKELPEVAERYTKTSQSRRFSIA